MLQATEHETEVALLSCVFSFLQTALLNFIPEPLFHPVADRVSHLALVRAAGGAVASTAPMLRSFPCLCSPAHSPLARASFGVSLASAPSVSGNLRPLSVRAFWMDVAVQTAFTPAALLRLLHLLHFQDVLLGRLAFRPASAKSPHSNASTSAAFSSADKHETRGNKRASNARGLTPEGSSWMTGKKRQEQEEICGEQRGNKGEAAGDMSQFSELSLLECLKTRRRADDETQTGRRGSVAGPSGVHTTGTGWKEQAKRELEKPRCRQAFVGRSLSRGERGKIESFSRSRALALVSDSERRPRRARISSRQSSSIAFHGVSRSPSFPFLPCCGVLPPFVCETCLEHAGERRKMFPQPFCLASSHRRLSAGAVEKAQNAENGETKERKNETTTEHWSLLGEASREAEDEAGNLKSQQIQTCYSPHVSPEWEKVTRGETKRTETGSREGSEGRSISAGGSADRGARDANPEESETATSICGSRSDSRKVDQSGETRASQKLSEEDVIRKEHRCIRREVSGGPREARPSGITRSTSASSHPLFSSGTLRGTSVAVCRSSLSPVQATCEREQPYSVGNWCSACGAFSPFADVQRLSPPGVHIPRGFTEAASSASRSPEFAVAIVESLEQELSRVKSGRNSRGTPEDPRSERNDEKPTDKQSCFKEHDPAERHAGTRTVSQTHDSGSFLPTGQKSPSTHRNVDASGKKRSTRSQMNRLGDDTPTELPSGTHVPGHIAHASRSASLEQFEFFASKQFVQLTSEFAEGTVCRVLRVPHIPQGAVSFPPFLTQAQRWTLLERLFACRDTDLAAVAPPFALAPSRTALAHHDTEVSVVWDKRENLPVFRSNSEHPAHQPHVKARRQASHSLLDDVEERRTRERAGRLDPFLSGAGLWADVKQRLLYMEMQYDKNIVRAAAGAARCHAAVPSYECKFAHFRLFIDPPVQSSSVAAAAAAALAAFQQRTPGHRELLTKFEDLFFDCIFDVYLQLPRPMAHAVWTHLFPFHHPTTHTVHRIQLLLLKVHKDLRKRTLSLGTSPATDAFPVSGMDRMEPRTNKEKQYPRKTLVVGADSRTAGGKAGHFCSEGGRDGSRAADTGDATRQNRRKTRVEAEQLAESDKRGTAGGPSGGARAEAERNALICLLRAASDAQARLLLTRRCRSAVRVDVASAVKSNMPQKET
ncbi:hypothetical protein TGFOU_262600 [Toxoplasma gondii FOU]|uniref:Uncharacterized protein n=2 Tax=Toxoplasma gondii TaxID=5811 RepID=A0A086L7N6_TOXGO|nr:hypothetical protein TGFOU_262600 [Toxoplasma gondii FOU]PUA89820.1 hypothetical protein TGBR9_262600 [Toxoplasma gondii TgCATBr9]